MKVDLSQTTEPEELGRLESSAYGLAYSEWQKWFWEFANDYGKVVVIRRGDRPVAAAMLLPTLAGTIYLETMVVAPLHQRRGFGSTLLIEIARYADAHQVSVELHTQAREENRGIVRLYEKFGFRKQGKPTPRYYGNIFYQHMVREPRPSSIPSGGASN